MVILYERATKRPHAHMKHIMGGRLNKSDSCEISRVRQTRKRHFRSSLFLDLPTTRAIRSGCGGFALLQRPSPLSFQLYAVAMAACHATLRQLLLRPDVFYSMHDRYHPKACLS